MQLARQFDNRASNHGVALIIVLAFVVLLTGLGVAYLSRSATDLQVAHFSFNDTDASILARSALDIIVADFKKEIIDDGTVTSANILPIRSGNPFYVPATGSATPTDPVPNLIRRSWASDNNLPAAIRSRASAVNSTSDASTNGRSVALDRWNSHYLLPRHDPTSASRQHTTESARR